MLPKLEETCGHVVVEVLILESILFSLLLRLIQALLRLAVALDGGLGSTQGGRASCLYGDFASMRWRGAEVDIMSGGHWAVRAKRPFLVGRRGFP